MSIKLLNKVNSRSPNLLMFLIFFLKYTGELCSFVLRRKTVPYSYRHITSDWAVRGLELQRCSYSRGDTRKVSIFVLRRKTVPYRHRHITSDWAVRGLELQRYSYSRGDTRKVRPDHKFKIL
jgi:hypothetical protein